jgi:predicted NAD/FAD-dependent oxidoreductase
MIDSNPGGPRSAIIVGAGVAGLACAADLARAGIRVTLLDKGRRPGGRVATRRAEGLMFNHGAQFATARGERFTALLDSAPAVPWPEAGPGRTVFVPGMSALPAAMARGLETMLLADRHAAFLHAAGTGWAVRHFPAAEMRPGQTAPEGGVLTQPHDTLVIAAPAPQAAALLATAGHAFAASAADAVIAPCWAVMARFPDAVPGPAVLDGAGPVIAWAARESSRPGRGAEPAEAWTMHASPAWSRAHLEDSPESVCAAMLDAFRATTGAPGAGWARAHRWRHAQVETPVGRPCLWDPGARIGACGDWCLSPRIESAYDSGTALAAAILAA